MPRHVRVNVMNGFQTVLDRAWEFQELERLTKAEKEDVVGLRSEMLLLKHRFAKIVEVIEERGDFQPPERLKGPLFSWAIRDAIIVARRTRKKDGTPETVETLTKRLEELQAKLEELQDESE